MLSRSPLAVGLLAMGSLAVLAGCGGDSSSTCDSTKSKLNSCSLVPFGINFACTEPSGDNEACQSDCMLSANCTELREAFCSHDMSQSLRNCMSQCQRFSCRNGETIDAYYRCDGETDCDDGSDEFGCASLSFKCKNGDIIEDDDHCDGYPDCDDESDELGCPTFMCKSGETIPESYKCDKEADCDDGSDEDGCPPPLESILLCE